MNWSYELERFKDDSRVAVRFLAHALGVRIGELLSAARTSARGCRRLEDGRRLLWRFHGAGVYVRLAGQGPVDVDLAIADGHPELVSDLWRLTHARRLRYPSEADVESLAKAGLLTAQRQIRFRVSKRKMN